MPFFNMIVTLAVSLLTTAFPLVGAHRNIADKIGVMRLAHSQANGQLHVTKLFEKDRDCFLDILRGRHTHRKLQR
jgi:hypothetical protein